MLIQQDTLGPPVGGDFAGNKCRPVANIRYDWQTVFIRHVFTHEEYDQWSKERA